MRPRRFFLLIPTSVISRSARANHALLNGTRPAAALRDSITHHRGEVSGRVFLASRGPRTPLAPFSLVTLFDRLGRRAGVKRAHAHRFRHIFATWTIENQAREIDVMCSTCWAIPRRRWSVGARPPTTRPRQPRRMSRSVQSRDYSTIRSRRGAIGFLHRLWGTKTSSALISTRRHDVKQMGWGVGALPAPRPMWRRRRFSRTTWAVPLIQVGVVPRNALLAAVGEGRRARRVLAPPLLADRTPGRCASGWLRRPDRGRRPCPCLIGSW